MNTAAAVTVTDTGTDLHNVTDENGRPWRQLYVLAQNLGAVDVFVGDATVTIATGQKIVPGADRAWVLGPGEQARAIVASGTAEVRVTLVELEPC